MGEGGRTRQDGAGQRMGFLLTSTVCSSEEIVIGVLKSEIVDSRVGAQCYRRRWESGDESLDTGQVYFRTITDGGRPVEGP